MHRSRQHQHLGILVCFGLLMGVPATAQLRRTSEVHGVVRDLNGTPQMGVVVQVLLSGSVVSGSALTDLQGRYAIRNLIPGRYSVLAAGVLLTPVVHRMLSLPSESRTTVNLTLTSLGNPATWLHEQRRSTKEAVDDWEWTLRSPANRPLLHVFDREDAASSSPKAEGPLSKPQHRVHIATRVGAGGFGRSGPSQRITETAFRNGSYVAQLAFEARTPRASGDVIVSEHLTADLVRNFGLSGDSRVLVSYESHPELLAQDGTSGLRSLRVASARRLRLGPAAWLDAGSLVDAIPAGGFLKANPFLSLHLQPSSTWSAGYALATSRAAQKVADLSAVANDVPPVVGSAHHLREARQLHQEVFVEKRSRRRRIRATYYRDGSGSVLVSGVRFPLAIFGAEEKSTALFAGSPGVLLDTSSAAFRTLAKISASQGMSLQALDQLQPGLWLALSYDLGTTLISGNDLQHLLGSGAWRQVRSHAVRIELIRDLRPTGAKLRTSYRWQPSETLLDVNAFQSPQNEGYLGFHLRQPLRCRGLLPDGVELMADGSNVLAQGYRRSVLDGHTFFFAGTPRVITAGLSVSF